MINGYLHKKVDRPLAEAFDLRSESETRLDGTWLVVARLVCLTLCVLAVGFYVGSVFSYIAHHYCAGPTASCHTFGPIVVRSVQGLGIYTIVRNSIFSLGYWLVAAFLFWRKSDDRVALLAAVSLGIFPIVFNNGFLSTLPSAWWLPAQSVSFLGSLCFSLFYYVFPTGHFGPRWVRWVFMLVLIYQGITTFFPFASFNLFFLYPLLNNLFFIGQIASFIVVQIYRYRRVSSPVQRQQSKWVVYGLSLAWGGYLVLLNLKLVFPTIYQASPLVNVIAGTALYGFILLIPFFLGLAIVRSRLWDIDLLINRTLVYGCLSVCVVGVYVLVVGYLGALLGASGNLVISLVATGLVAVLFQPLRAWLQRGVNRLLYGQRDEPYTVITHLSQRLAGTLASGAVLSTIVETVAQALKLPYVAILLKQEDAFQLAASAGVLVGEPLVLPLVYQKEAIGQLCLAQRAIGESFTPADRRLLDELARQAGLAAHAVRLNADLQRSYAHLEQRVEERTRELASLLEISQTVASTLQLKPLLRLILDKLQTVVDYTGAAILTLEGEELVFLDSRSPTPEEELHQLRLLKERLGPIWKTMTTLQPVCLANIRDDSDPAETLHAGMGEVIDTTFANDRACLLVPLTLKDQIKGLLVLTSSEANAFTPHQAKLAQAIANQAAIAIENARLYEQAQTLAALEERQKLARELHDSVSQALYSIALGVHTARTLLDRDPALVAEPLEDLLALAKGGLAEMRALIFELRPESLETEGIVSALTKQAEALQARHEIAVHLNLGAEPDLPLSVKQELYRIAQEALHNTIKHAQAHQVNLCLSQKMDVFLLEVRDDGVGFDPTSAFPGHLGLHSMRERINRLGGTLQIESAPGEGTTITVGIRKL